MAVPYTFGSATTSIPLSQLDSNFATTITLGNTAIQLGNTVTTLNNMTLANATVSSGNVTVTTLTAPTHNSASSLTFQTNGTTTAMTIDTSQNVGIGTTSVLSGYKVDVRGIISSGATYGGTFAVYDTSGASRVGYMSSDAFASGNNDTNLSITADQAGKGIKFYTAGSSTVRAFIDSSGNLLVGTTSNITGAKINIAAGSSDGVMYQIAQFTGGSGTGGNEVGEMKRQTTASVANSATTIESSLTFGELVTVTGVGAGAIFADLLMASYNTVSVISSNTQQGSPASRTYSISSGALKLTMGSATAMYITIQSLISGAKGA